ncbi:MAG: hypothetical protein K2M46_13795 [Lachnospiraceae bacterium]|nr:hypothetical protein [Lachnospiraceae bacterium]
MLGKLIKHEWKAVAKILGFLHLALIGMAVLGKILVSIDFIEELDFIRGGLLLVYIISVMAIGIGTHIFLAMRFYKNMYTDEGYLSFTLPVKPWQHLISKLLVAAAWIVIDVIAIVISVFILVMYQGMWQEMADSLGTITENSQEITWKPLVIGVETLLEAFFGMIMTILMYYFSISVGQLFKTHKLLASVVIFVVTFNVLRIISVIVTGIAMYASINGMDNVNNFYLSFVGMGLVQTLAFCVIFWCSCQYIMTKRLNLE